VATDKAATVLLVADTSIPAHEQHKKLISTLLTLKSKGWPCQGQGQIIVESTPEMNPEIIKRIYPDKVEVVVVGEIGAKLMVQSAVEHGIAGVFGEVLGFEGDEIYSKEWPELVGSTFRDVYFRIPEAVAIGVFTEDGDCLINPGWDYRVQKDESIIVLAEDDDTYAPKASPYFHHVPQASPRGSQLVVVMEEIEDPKVLIVGWSSMIGNLLISLDSRTKSAKEVSVTIYSDRPADKREAEIHKLKQANTGASLERMTITNVVVDQADFTARHEIEYLRHWECNAIFILVSDEQASRSDETNVATLVQMQDIGLSHNSMYEFDPVVEICAESTEARLKVLGLTNVIHTGALVSKALASVAYTPSNNKIYNELSAATRNEFDISRLDEYVQEGQTCPQSVSFGQAAHLIGKCSQTVLIGWTERGEDGEIEWVLNPKDKTKMRPWSSQDRVCVIKQLKFEMRSKTYRRLSSRNLGNGTGRSET
jgi:hypothetical protein